MEITDDQRYCNDLIGRIREHVVACNNGCIEYRPGVLKHKYGLISVTRQGKRKGIPAHRVMWMASNCQLDLSRDVVIRHKCDNKRCVNIGHLEPGTHKDNTRDKIERNRYAKKYRLHTRHRVLDDEAVLAIRAEPDNMKTCYIALKYKISNGYVSKLRSGKAKTLVI